MVHRAAELKSTIKYWVRPDIENRIKEDSITARFNSCVKEIRPTTIVISSRVRLARNLAKLPFPGWAKKTERIRILDEIKPDVDNLGQMRNAFSEQLNELSARPAPPSIDPKAIDKSIEDIAARLARLESAQAAPRAPVTDPVVLGRINAAENATKSLADNAAALSRRAEATDAALREINGRIDKLTATLTDVQTTARSAAAGSDRASRLAVAASALRNAVEHGDPFTAELAIVKPLAPDANAIAALEPFAASGVPGNAALGQELAAIVRPMLSAAGEPPRDGTFLDRLQANAQKLVRVRPVDQEPRGDDRAALLTRVEQRATQGNIAGALTELNKLSPEARAPAQAWIAKTEARNKAIEASRRLAADAVAALKAAP